MNRRSIMLTIRGVSGFALLLAVVFVPAGRSGWLQGWIFTGAYLGMTIGVAVLLRYRHPELLERRLRTQRGAVGWDRILVGVYGMVVLPSCVVLAGLDERLRLGPSVPWSLQVSGLFLFLLSGALVIRAMLVNPHFEAHVRLQDDRDHQVVDAGPYRVVRHPGYVGMAGLCLGIPLVLASWWALLPGAAGVLLVVVRTALEDRYLRRHLPGYTDYAARVRYRLVPPVW